MPTDVRQTSSRNAAKDADRLTIGELSAMPAEMAKWLDKTSAFGIYGSSSWYRMFAETVCSSKNERSLVCSLQSSDTTEPRACWVFAHDWSHRSARDLANYYSALAGVHWSEPRHLLALFKCLQSSSLAVDSVTVGPLPGDPAEPNSIAGQTLASLRRSGFVAIPRVAYINWYLPRPECWEAYWESRPGKLRSTVQRKGKRFSEHGGRFAIYSSCCDVELATSAFQAVYANSWKAQEPHTAFIPALIRLLAQQGSLRLGVAWLEHVPVAAQLWLHAAGKTEIFKLAYDQRYKEWSAGSLLTAHLMKHAIDVDLATEVDFLSGDDSYKADWMDLSRRRWFLDAAHPSTLRGAVSCIRLGLSAVKSHLLRAVRRSCNHNSSERPAP